MSSRSIAATVPRTRGSSAVRKPTRGISSRLASSSLLPKLCVKVLRSLSNPSPQIVACMRSRTFRQVSSGAWKLNRSASRTVRSRATQAMIDPETRLDAIRHVKIRGGQIEAVSERPLDGQLVVDANGLVVAPGFIDWHVHGQSILADRVLAFDGVTTSLELEMGLLPLGRWYDIQAATGRVLNYGAASSWGFARVATLEDIPLSM